MIRISPAPINGGDMAVGGDSPFVIAVALGASFKVTILFWLKVDLIQLIN